jgi:hypothetical protein
MFVDTSYSILIVAAAGWEGEICGILVESAVLVVLDSEPAHFKHFLAPCYHAVSILKLVQYVVVGLLVAHRPAISLH